MTPREFIEKYPRKTIHDYFVQIEKNHQTSSAESTFKYVGEDSYRDTSRKNITKSSLKPSNIKRIFLLSLMLAITVFSFITAQHFFLLLIVPIAFSGFYNACPNCSTWFVRKRLSKEELDRYHFFEDIIRKDKIKDKTGEVIGEIERKEQVTKTRIKYLNTYCCQHCGLIWSNKSTETH